MKIGCVVTSCGLTQLLVDRFVANNKLVDKGIRLFITTFKGDNITAEGATITEIDRMEVFNIGKAVNISLRKAIESCELVIKTDIDCILSDDCISQVKMTKANLGFAYRYWEVKDAESINESSLNPRTMGTLCLSAEEWSNLRGYDERLSGYGFDDYHMVQRARIGGCMVPIQMEPKVYHISHDEKHNRSTINPLNRRANIEVSASEWTNTEASKKWGCLV